MKRLLIALCLLLFVANVWGAAFLGFDKGFGFVSATGYQRYPVQPVLQSTGPNIDTLLTGQVNESPTVVNATLSIDTDHYMYGTRAHKLTTSGAVTAQLRLAYPSNRTFLPSQAVGAWIYVPDPTAVTSVTVEIAQDSGITVLWARSFTPVAGWNLFRAYAAAGTTTLWGNCYRIRVNAVTSAATSITVSQIWVEPMDTARIVIIEDGGYDAGFYSNTVGYTDLRSRGLNIVWAVDLAIFAPVDTNRITWAQLSSVRTNGDEINYHGATGDPTSSMTADQIRSDDLGVFSVKSRCGIAAGWLDVVIFDELKLE